MSCSIRNLSISIFCVVLSACGGDTGSDSGASSGGNNTGNISQSSPVVTKGWNTQTQISSSRSDFDYDLLLPDVDINDSGLAVSAWVEEFNSSPADLPSIWVNVIQSGVEGTPFKITTSTSTTPKVAVSNNGDAIVIFDRLGLDNGGISSRSIWARHYKNGVWESSEIAVSGLPANDYSFYAFSPDIGIDQDGNAIAVWTQQDSNAANTSTIIYASYYDGTNWGAPFRLNNATTRAFEATIAMNDSGIATVVWSEDTNPYNPSSPGYEIPNMWARVFINSSWVAPVKIGTPTLQRYDGTSRQDVAINSNGNAIAVWEEGQGSNFNIVESRLDVNSNIWSTANPIATSTKYVSYTRAVMLENGDAAVIWAADNGTTNDGVIRYFDSSANTWLDSEYYEAISNSVFYSHIGSDGQDNVYVTWTQFITGSSMKQFSRKYSLLYGWTDYGSVSSGFDFSMASNFNGEVILVNFKDVGIFDEAAFSTYYLP